MARVTTTKVVVNEIKERSSKYTLNDPILKKSKPYSIIDDNLKRAIGYIDRPIRDYTLLEKEQTMTLESALPKQ